MYETGCIKLINKAKMMDLIDEDSTKYNLEPLPGLNESELKDLEKKTSVPDSNAHKEPVN
jgi:hypothetical protein